MNPLIELKTTTPLILLALVCFGLLPKTQAVIPPPDGGYPGSNTAEGENALFSLTSGINNTAVGAGALHDNTTGGYNVGIGSRALASNISGSFNMAVGTEALRDNTANFNLAIGYRVGFKNTTGRHLTGIGATALLNNTTASFNTAIGAAALQDNNTGEENTAIGADALSKNTDGDFNMASGASALLVNTHGERNTATGNSAMFSNTTGERNTASGNAALGLNVGGDANTAVGQAAGFGIHGNENTAVGVFALGSPNTGSGNTAVGAGAGSGYNGTEHDNICIGSQTLGVAGESNTIRIGTSLPSSGINISAGGLLQAFNIGEGFTGGGIQYSQFLNASSISIASGFSTVNGNSSCFIGGIFNQAPAPGSHFVLVGPNGKLADATLSSRRFKKDIAPIDKISEGILALKPVTFHWKNDKTNEPEFGLIAEDVAEVNLDWITRDPQGEISGVRYETIPVLLLNEFLKEHKKVEEQQASIAELKSTVAQQQKGMEVLTAQLKEQAAQIQKVSAQLEASKPAPQVVNNP
jgi:hypothetical protein